MSALPYLDKECPQCFQENLKKQIISWWSELPKLMNNSLTWLGSGQLDKLMKTVRIYVLSEVSI